MSRIKASPTLHQVVYGAAHEICAGSDAHQVRAVRTTAAFRGGLAAVCAEGGVRRRLLQQVQARLSAAADCYRITDKLPGALVTPPVRGLLPALRFIFDGDAAVCTLRDVQPLAAWPSHAMIDARGAARLALELALHSGDAQLADHLALAIVRDAATVVWRGDRMLTEGELFESRADGWARVWAHLAGEAQPLMGHRGPHPGNPRAVWVVVRFHDVTGDVPALQRRIRLAWDPCGCPVCHAEGEEIWAVGAEMRHRSSGDRGYRVGPTAVRSEMIRWGGKLAGMATVVVEWGLFGWGTDGSSQRLGEVRQVLPVGARAGRNCVERLLRDVESRVRTAGTLRLPTRRRLVMHPEHVAIYLLHGPPTAPGTPPRGYGRLPRHGWRKTAEAFWGRPLRTADSDAHENREHAKVRNGYAAALRLRANWRALAAPR